MKNSNLFSYRYIGKRIIDTILAFVIVIAILPLLAVLSIIVFFEIGKPVIFKQKRIGRHGEPFVLYKFRTMRDSTASFQREISGICALLRKLSLDELPSLINILAGNLSFVGPRPFLLTDYLPLCQMCSERFQILPGLTGPAQIAGRNSLSWRRRLAHDLRYYSELSLREDVTVLVRTCGVILFPDRHAFSRSVVGVRLAREMQE